MTSVVTKDSAQAVLGSFTYDLHDKVGNRKHITEQVKQPDGSTASSELTYDYDNAYRLTDEARTGANAYTINFTYDKVGNRLTQTKDATLTEYTYNSRNQLITTNSELITTNYGYDLNGSLTSRTTGPDTTTYGWNRQGKLSTVYGIQDTVYYFYDGDGNRIRRVDGSGELWYLNDVRSLTQVVAEYDGSGAPLRSYTYGSDLVSTLDPGSLTLTYFLYDASQSARRPTPLKPSLPPTPTRPSAPPSLLPPPTASRGRTGMLTFRFSISGLGITTPLLAGSSA